MKDAFGKSGVLLITGSLLLRGVSAKCHIAMFLSSAVK